MYEDRVLAFIDILGFSESINKTISSGIENEEVTNRINNLIEGVQWSINFDKELNGKCFNSKIVNQFSDSIIISYLKNEESGIFQILLEILYLCATAIRTGFLLRGAIVCDKVCHTKKKVFGPALVKAYEMEKSMAIYPRIILDDSIINIAKIYHNRDHDPEMEVDFINDIILRDFDGLYFINYFDAIESELDCGFEEMPEYFECFKGIIKELELNENISVKSKYLWLKNKFNIVINKYKERYKKDDVKRNYPELFEYYKNIKLFE